MAITVNLYYIGKGDAHHVSPMMAGIAQLRDKYGLHMVAERYAGSRVVEGASQQEDEFDVVVVSALDVSPHAFGA